MAAPLDYNIEVESILGGLESALARGQPLEKAMKSFRNAGYKEENIIEAAKKFQILHRRRFHELGVDPNQPEKRIQGAVASSEQTQSLESNKEEIQKPKQLVNVQTREKLMEQYEREKAEMESRAPKKRIVGSVQGASSSSEDSEDSKFEEDEDLREEEARLRKTAGEAPIPIEEESSMKSKKGKDKRIFGSSRESDSWRDKPQVVSGYGDEALRASENFRAAVDQMVKSLSNINIQQPSKVIVKEGKQRNQKPQVINKISNYGMKPPTPVNKAVTFLLIFLLIILLGMLAAVFFFREELIDLFNTLTLE